VVSGLAATVVVPSRDRPDALARCLQALDGQVGVDLEVVVVDDASLDAGAVARVVASSPNAQLVVGSGRGPAAARNLGAARAAGPVICFTDDDCRPQPGWVVALARRLADEPEAAAAAGPTRNGRVDDVVAAAAQVVTNHLMAASLDPVTGRLGFAPTSNLAVRAEVHRALPFDEGYPLAAGEDRDWCARLTASGQVLVHEPEAVVDHHPDLDVRRFWRQQLRYGRGAARFRSEGDQGMAPLGFYTGLVKAGFAHGPRTGGLVLLAQVATAAGVARERWGR
jgi:cellulose synthase/poly-beta-1,6-N-acetylglucosamine synthase-like glycosyltransferase